MKRMLVGVDGSSESRKAADYAARIAGALGLGLELAHVVPAIVEVSPQCLYAYTGLPLRTEWAQRAIGAGGLDNLAQVRHLDYRDVTDTGFDAISSIGLTEHIGKARLPGYFSFLYGKLPIWPRTSLLIRHLCFRLQPIGHLSI